MKITIGVSTKGGSFLRLDDVIIIYTESDNPLSQVEKDKTEGFAQGLIFCNPSADFYRTWYSTEEAFQEELSKYLFQPHGVKTNNGINYKFEREINENSN